MGTFVQIRELLRQFNPELHNLIESRRMADAIPILVEKYDLEVKEQETTHELLGRIKEAIIAPPKAEVVEEQPILIPAIFEDDFARFKTLVGSQDVRIFDLPPEYQTWPPAEEIVMMGTRFRRVSFSAITSEQRLRMTRICRGALYVEERRSEDRQG